VHYCVTCDWFVRCSCPPSDTGTSGVPQGVDESLAQLARDEHGLFIHVFFRVDSITRRNPLRVDNQGHSKQIHYPAARFRERHPHHRQLRSTGYSRNCRSSADQTVSQYHRESAAVTAERSWGCLSAAVSDILLGPSTSAMSGPV